MEKEEKNQKYDSISGYSQATVVGPNGKNYTVITKKDAYGNVIYTSMTEKFLGIF